MLTSTVEMVPIAKVNGNRNVRHTAVKAMQGTKLLASIKAVGQKVPIAVHKKDDGKFDLIYGGRRLACMQSLKHTEIEAIVYAGELTPADFFEITFWENMGRKDLSPIEELRAIGEYSDQFGYKEIANRLGIPEYRARMYQAAQKGLIRPLFKAFTNEKHELAEVFAEMQPGHFAVIARLSQAQQEELLKNLEELLAEWNIGRDYGGGFSAADVDTFEKDVERHYYCALTGTPWAHDDAELYPDAGACSECPKRSDRKDQLEMFPEGEDKNPRCLDRTCYLTKQERAIKRAYAELKEKYPDLVVVGDYAVRNVADAYNIPTVSPYEIGKVGKKADKGTVPHVTLNKDGLFGKVQYRKKSRASTSRPSGPSTDFTSTPDGKKVKTLKKRREELHSKRVHALIPKLQKILKGVTFENTPVYQQYGTAGATLLVYVYGTDTNRACSSTPDFEIFDSNLFQVESEEGDHGPGAFLPAAAKQKQEVMAEDFWLEVRKIIDQRLDIPAGVGKTQVNPAYENEARDVCALIGVDFDEQWAEICKEIKEPKSWKNLKADGTAKTNEDKLKPTKEGEKNVETKGDQKKESVPAPAPEAAGKGRRKDHDHRC